jgi:predicted component of type VI protein secretion system
VPEEEVMAQKIEAYEAASTLFSVARSIVQWQKKVRLQRMFNTTNEYAAYHNNTPEKRDRDKKYNRHMGRDFARGFKMHLDRYNEVPPDFRLIETGGSADKVVSELGRVLGARALKQALAEAA